MPDERIQKQNVGNAGEYYIAARLSALDFVATITLGRAEKYDILAISPKGRVVKISVKTAQNEKARDFPLSRKDEEGAADDFYYAFVKLNKFNKEPDFWVIPSKVVCPLIANAHKKWLTITGSKGQAHNDSAMRVLPVDGTEWQQGVYEKGWNEKVKQYYKALDQLK